MHVNGDMNTHALYALLVRGADEKEIKLCDVNFHGWRYIDAGLSSLESGKEYKFVGFKLQQSEGPCGQSGTVKVDNLLKTITSSGVEDAIIADVKVFPNPSSDYIVVSADGVVEKVELYSISGALVAVAKGNIVNVSDINSGNYVLKVFVNGLTAKYKVIVNHN